MNIEFWCKEYSICYDYWLIRRSLETTDAKSTCKHTIRRTQVHWPNAIGRKESSDGGNHCPFETILDLEFLPVHEHLNWERFTHYQAQ